MKDFSRMDNLLRNFTEKGTNPGWTGGTGIWAEADPVDRFSVVYMHNMRPNEELYHHHRVRAVINGIML